MVTSNVVQEIVELLKRARLRLSRDRTQALFDNNASSDEETRAALASINAEVEHCESAIAALEAQGPGNAANVEQTEITCEPAAWMDDKGLIVTAQHKAVMCLHEQEVTRSIAESYSIPLYAAPPEQEAMAPNKVISAKLHQLIGFLRAQAEAQKLQDAASSEGVTIHADTAKQLDGWADAVSEAAAPEKMVEATCRNNQCQATFTLSEYAEKLGPCTACGGTSFVIRDIPEAAKETAQ